MQFYLLLSLFLFFAAPVGGVSQVIYQETIPAYVNHFVVKGVTKRGKTFFLMPVHRGYAEESFKLWQDPDVISNNENDDEMPPLWRRVREYGTYERLWDNFYAVRGEEKMPSVTLRYVIVDAEGVFLGEAGIIPASGELNRDIIYYNVAKEHRGKGIATAVAKKLVDIFRNYWPNHQLYLYFKNGNVGSEKVAQHAGFKPSLLPNGKPETKEAFGKKFTFYKLASC